MYLLLDECIGRSCLTTASALGHTAQRTIEVATLGRQASDRDIFDFACRHHAILVTVNRGDFIALAGRGSRHPGVILVPSLPKVALQPLFATALAAAQPLFEASENVFVEIDATGVITSFRLP